MRSRVIVLVLWVSVLPFFSCEEQKKEPVKEQTEKKMGQMKRIPAAPAKVAEKPAPQKSKEQKALEAKIVAETKAMEKAKKKAPIAAKPKKEEAKKKPMPSPEEKAKAKAEAEAKKAAEKAAKEKARREAKAKKEKEKAEKEKAKREAEAARYAELGITVKPTIVEQRLRFLGEPVTFHGVEVVAVKSGSVAAEAGLRKGDLIEGVCNRAIDNLSNVVDGMLRALPLEDRLAPKAMVAAVAERDAITRRTTFAVVRDAAQVQIDFTAPNPKVERTNYALIVAEYQNIFAKRTDVLGGAILCEKRTKHFKSCAWLGGALLDVKEYGGWTEGCLLGFIKWRKGECGDVSF